MACWQFDIITIKSLLLCYKNFTRQRSLFFLYLFTHFRVFEMCCSCFKIKCVQCLISRVTLLCSFDAILQREDSLCRHAGDRDHGGYLGQFSPLGVDDLRCVSCRNTSCALSFFILLKSCTPLNWV